MKAKILMIASLWLAAVSAVPVAEAEGWSGRQLTFRVSSRGTRLLLIKGAEGDWNNPDACSDSSVLVLSPETASSAESFAEHYAMLLSAHVTGRELGATVDGCLAVGTRTHPIATDLVVY